MFYIEYNKETKICTGNYAEDMAQPDWTCIETEDFPEEQLIYHKVVDDKLVFDEELKKQIEQQDSAYFEIEQLELFLKETDWYTARFVDSQVPIPEEVVNKRREARLRISELRELV